MKKMIKYVGIAAATLFAVAPITMPIVASAATDVEGNVIPADGTYTDNGDGTYTLHGQINGSVWTDGANAHETGTALPISIEGINVSSTGEVLVTAPEIAGYKNTSIDGKYQLMLDDGDVYLFSVPSYVPLDGSNENTGTPGVAYSTTVTLTRDAIIEQDNGTPVVIPGTRDFKKLSAGSSWKVDRKMYMSGETYYRVGSNIWVDKKDVTEQAPASTETNTVTTNKQAFLYHKNGDQVANRGLAANTSWYTDQSATINGQKMYRVATDEWLSVNDVK